MKKTVELFLLDGNSNGRMICTLSNWDGICLKIPKTKVKISDDRKELRNSGVYILFSSIDSESRAYIGEAENVQQRLKQHLVGKDFWNECLVFTRKDNSLNKAHIKYLEKILHESAKNVNRSKLDNKCTPSKCRLSESETSSIETYATNVKMLTNILGYKLFEKLIEREYGIEEYYYIKSIGLEAKGILTNEGFVVLKGSDSNMCFKKASSVFLKKNWERLREDRIINKENKFVRDYLFSSPSRAAAMILGRNANGLTEWKNKGKKTLKEVLLELEEDK
ncbi:MAG: GIY-YIG nuclease family protein [Anaerorhabdus sp.]|uniref:GIY-YIG nuclease family protein n=1 Tax=Anaerorhabdus sp. TaxID=1872524 RepID=UPI003A88A28E